MSYKFCPEFLLYLFLSCKVLQGQGQIDQSWMRSKSFKNKLFRDSELECTDEADCETGLTLLKDIKKNPYLSGDEVNELHRYPNGTAIAVADATPPPEIQLTFKDVFCINECDALSDALDSKSGLIWIIPKFLNAFFRGIGEVIFANNPWSGLLILIGIFWYSIPVGLLTSLSVAVAIFTSLFLRQGKQAIQIGLTTYNAVLVGSVTSALWTSFYNEPIFPKVVGLVIVGSVLSVFVQSGLTTNLIQWGLPSLTLAFNIVTVLLFADFKPILTTTTNTARSLASLPSPVPLKQQIRMEKPIVLEGVFTVGNKTSLFDGSFFYGPNPGLYPDLDVFQVLGGIVYSMGQVYGVQTFFGSIVMYLGLLIYSRISFVMSVIGAGVGTFAGLLFTTKPPYTNVYKGIWGYNGILAAIAVGGYFFRLNSLSFLVAIMDVIFAVLIQQALSLAFQSGNVPVFTFPFCLSTLIFLSVTTTRNYLQRVKNLSYPEKHIQDFIGETQRNQAIMMSMNNTSTNPNPTTMTSPSDMVLMM